MIVDVIDLGLKVINFTKNYDPIREAKARKIYNDELVSIKNVEKLEEGKDTFYDVRASVCGNNGVYSVKLNIKNTTLKDSSCTCPDNDKGNLCKHILATCMEVIDPHTASTKEGIKKINEEKTQEIQKRIEAQRLQQEKLEKEREYKKRFSNAINMLEVYKLQESKITDLNNLDKFDIEDLYNDIHYSILNTGRSDELATNIKIEPKVRFDVYSNFEVSFKIGQTTMYSLKDTYGLYKAFLNEEIIEFGKKLKFCAKRENFCKSDQKLLDIILEYGKFQKYQEDLNRSSYYYYSSSRDSKAMRLFDDKIDDFFEAIVGKSVNFENYGSEGIYTMANEKIYPTISVSQNLDGNFVLKLNINNYFYINSLNKTYLLYNGKIYTMERSTELVNLLKNFKDKQEIEIPNDRFSEFSTYVLPKLEKYINKDYENSDEDSDKQKVIVINKLATKVYLDLDEKDNITMVLKFCYLDKEFNILDKECKKYVEQNNIMRNIKDEKEVLTRIFSDGFEIVKGKDYFLLDDLDSIYDFLTEKIDGYMNDFEVLVTDRFKNKKIRKTKVSNLSVRLDNGLLEVDMSKIDIDMSEIKKILQSYNIKKKYYKLKNGDFLALNESEDLDFLNDMSNSLDIDFEKMKNGVIKLPVNRSLYLEKLLNRNEGITATKNDEYNKLINNVSNKNFSDNITVSKNFQNILRPYQVVGYKWLKVLENYGFGGILADDMGLGKTLQVISLLESSINSNSKTPSIVICPSSLVLNWKSEVEKWCSRIKVLIVKGDAKTRKELISTYRDYDLVITSYDLLKRDVFEYEDKKFKYIIADEAQYIKNFSTQNATSLKSLNGESKFALTGTPIENSVAELWSIFDFVMPGYLYSYNKFKKKFEEPILKLEDKDAMKRLKTLIEPFILRRLKKDVLTELPDKNVTVLNSEMTPEQEKLYFAYMAQIKQEVAEEVNENGFEKSKLKILMLLTRLRQICCHPGLFLDNYNGESGKLIQCMDILSEAISSGHKILLFSQYTSMFEIIEEKFKKSNISYFKLTGSTPVDKRIEMVETFNKDESVKVFLISLKAGGTGLNLTGADVVIHYDPWWNLSSENQATDRAYRIGQKNSVQVYKLITSNSIEEKINKLQEKKAKLSEELLSTEETFINKLSKDEILSLFE